MLRRSRCGLLRGFTLIELMVVIAIITIAMSFLMVARPGRAARRIELVSGHKQIEELVLANAKHRDVWEFKIPHCEKLVRYCRDEAIYKELVNPDGTRGDHDVGRLESLVEAWRIADDATPSQPTWQLEPEIEALRVAIELRYLKLTPAEP